MDKGNIIYNLRSEMTGEERVIVPKLKLCNFMFPDTPFTLSSYLR